MVKFTPAIFRFSSGLLPTPAEGLSGRPAGCQFSHCTGGIRYACLPSRLWENHPLRVLAGLLKQTKGVWFSDPKLGQPKIGLNLSTTNLMPWRTVLRNITLPMELEGVSQPRGREKARIWIKQVD